MNANNNKGAFVNAYTLEILMSLTDEFNDPDRTYESKRPIVAEALAEAGLKPIEVHNTLDWLDCFVAIDPNQLFLSDTAAANTMRTYTDAEANKLGYDGIALLTHLYNLNVLDTLTREAVIDRAMACESEHLEPSQIRWITYMVATNQLSKKVDSTWLEVIIMHSADKPILTH